MDWMAPFSLCPPAGLCDLWVKIGFLIQSAFVCFVVNTLLPWHSVYSWANLPSL